MVRARSAGWLPLLLALALLVAGCASDPAALSLPEWTFVPPDGVRTSVTIPVHLAARLPHARSQYSLARKVTLDAAMQGRDLVLVIPRLTALATLYADGAAADSIEGPDLHAYRGRGPHAWRIPAAATTDGELDLEIRVQHTWTQSGWVDTVPRLTAAPDGGSPYVLQRTFNDVTEAAAATCALFAGYIYLVIYLSDRRRVSYAWFGATGVAGSVYPMLQTGLLAGALGPLETLMAALGVILSTAFEMPFTALHFGQPPPSRLWGLAAGVAVLLSAVSLGYFTNTQVAGPVAVCFVTPAIGSQVVLLFRLSRLQPQPPHLFTVLGGWAALAVLAAPDMIAWAGLGEVLGGTRTTPLGVLLVAFLQVATISRAHTRALRSADELAAERQARIVELEAGNREVQVLNEELRRQIGARSRQVAETIARIGIESGERALSSGELIEGRYEVIRALGAGTGGTVYLVERLVDRLQLAMKVVRGKSDAHALARLAREAQLAADVKHPNVISIVDVDIAPSGFLYVVMEYVPGATLRDHQDDFGRPEWALPVLAQIAGGLAAIHERGIVHRDLKPANVLILTRGKSEAPVAKISDFGIARGENAARVTGAPPPMTPEESGRGTVREGHDGRLTETGVVMGTPLYMAPESIDGARQAMPAVDVFAFGVIAYELVTAKLPFTASPALSQLDGQIVAPPVPVATAAPTLPIHVARLIDRCLDFDPSDRPTAREAYEILRRARSSRPAASS